MGKRAGGQGRRTDGVIMEVRGMDESAGQVDKDVLLGGGQSGRSLPNPHPLARHRPLALPRM